MRSLKNEAKIPIKMGATYNYANKTNVLMLSSEPCSMGMLEVHRLDNRMEEQIFYFDLTEASEDAWNNPDCFFDPEVGVITA